MVILEFFVQNYIFILAIAIIIILAIIGYYADKTNFGQGNNSQNNNNDKKLIDITTLGINDVAKESSDKKNVEQEKTLVSETPNLVDVSHNNKNESDATSITNMELPTLEESQNNEETKQSDSKKDVSVQEFVKVNNDESQIQSSSPSLDSDDIITKQEEEFKKFDLEFDSVLPEEELINEDLLTEIDELELGKTKKLELSDLTKFEDIELPKINNSVKKEQDIWRF